MPDYTGPIGPTKEEWEKWYHRFKDVAHMLHQRGFGMGVHEDDLPMAKDMAMRLVEDETWPHKWAPPLVAVSSYRDIVGNRSMELPMKKGAIVAVHPDTVEAMAFSQMLRSKKGFGRFAGLATPTRDGITNPWRPSGNGSRMPVPDDPDLELPDAGS